MNYYKQSRQIAGELNNWINNPDREEWSSFCRSIRMRFGVSKRSIEKMMEEDYPRLRILEDNLVTS